MYQGPDWAFGMKSGVAKSTQEGLQPATPKGMSVSLMPEVSALALSPTPDGQILLTCDLPRPVLELVTE
jgi:hypothetical protein